MKLYKCFEILVINSTYYVRETYHKIEDVVIMDRALL